MQSPDDTARLMRAFCESGDPAAFRALVARFLPLVLAAVLRRGDGDAALAEDVAQHVFADFARRMPRLRADDRIGAWLYRAAHLRAGDVLKSERRRKLREQQAAAMQEIDRLPESEGWQALSPVLDEALARLRARDREVLVLRFLDGLKIDALAHSQGISTAAAQKRVERALERLREKLGKSGIKGSVVVLSGLIASRGSSEAAPAMVERVASRSLDSLAASGAASASGLLSLPVAATAFLTVFGVGSLALTEKGGHADARGSSAPSTADRTSSLLPVVTALGPRNAANRSLSDIIDALGALHDAPLTSLDRLRVEVLSARIPEPGLPEALALMDARWSPTTLERADDLRRNFFSRWGNRQPDAALDWALGILSPDSASRSNWPSLWGMELFQTLSLWVHRDWPSAWEWSQAKIKDGVLKTVRGANVPEHFARALTPGLVEHLGLRVGLETMFDLQDTSSEPDYASPVQTISAKLADADEFLYVMDAIDRRVTAIQARVELKEHVLSKFGGKDWIGGLEWVRERTNDLERARFGWALGFPGENAPPGFDPTQHADWLISLNPDRKTYKLPEEMDAVVGQWMDRDPASAAAWVRGHEGFQNHMLANRIVSRVSVAASRSDEKSRIWLGEAKYLLRLVATRENRTPLSYWSDSFLVDDPEINSRIADFLQRLSTPE